MEGKTEDVIIGMAWDHQLLLSTVALLHLVVDFS